MSFCFAACKRYRSGQLYNDVRLILPDVTSLELSAADEVLHSQQSHAEQAQEISPEAEPCTLH